jgi:hypothetical protein
MIGLVDFAIGFPPQEAPDSMRSSLFSRSLQQGRGSMICGGGSEAVGFPARQRGRLLARSAAFHFARGQSKSAGLFSGEIAGSDFVADQAFR